MVPEIERNDYSFSTTYNLRDVWQKKPVGNTSQQFKAVVPAHNVVVLRLTVSKSKYNEKPWGGSKHSCYLPQIPNRWWSKDGLSGTLMFAGDYVGGNNEYYALMTQSFILKLK